MAITSLTVRFGDGCCRVHAGIPAQAGMKEPSNQHIIPPRAVRKIVMSITSNSVAGSRALRRGNSDSFVVVHCTLVAVHPVDLAAGMFLCMR